MEPTGASFMVSAKRLVLVVDHFGDDARTLRRSIDDVSRLRYDLAHELGHVLLLDCCSYNSSENSDVEAAVGPPAFADLLDNSLDASLAGATQAGAAFTSPLDGLRFNLWSRRVGASVELVSPVPGFVHFRGIYGPARALTGSRSPRVALPPDNRAALLRLLGGILAVLCLMLVRVLAALSRRPDALTFVLVMLAACLRYGRREDPDDGTSLPIRRYRPSLGSCP